MYLLKLAHAFDNIPLLYHLHSTMYLLKQAKIINSTDNLIFTFHYVSIKTRAGHGVKPKKMNLHSTMYLLKQSTILISPPNFFIYIPLCIY